MSRARRLIHAVQRRERLAQATMLLGQVALPGGLLLAAAATVASRLLLAPAWLTWLALLPVPTVIAWAYLRRLSLRVTARHIDAHYGLHDRLGNAMELGATPGRVEGRAADIVGLLVSDAEELAANLDPAPVVPLRIPGPRRLDALAALCLGAAMLLPQQHPPRPPQARAQGPTPAAQGAGAVTGKDLALAEPLRQDLNALEEGDDPAAKTAAALLDLLEGLETGKLDRELAFEKLEKLEQELVDAEAALEAELDEDPALLAEALRELGDALEKHEITEDAARALEQDDPDALERELDEAAEEADTGDASDREAMRKAMEEAERRLRKQANRSSETAAALAEAERRLKREQKRESSDPKEKERRLKRMQERVKELRRQHEREAAARRQAQELRRNAAQASNRGGSKQSRREGARKLSRNAGGSARKVQRHRRLGRARDSLDETKSFVRRVGRQGEGEKRRRKQFRKFMRAASGKNKDNKGKPTMIIEGDVGDGAPSSMMMGEEGQGDGKGQQAQGQGEDQGSQQGAPSEGAGDGAVESLGDPTKRAVDYSDQHASPAHGRGATRAEVIRASSQEGFAAESYRSVYEDYRSFAQSALDNESLPAAQRRRIKRYFQLIQPRKKSAPPSQ